MADFNGNAHLDDNILLHLAVIEENLDVVKFLLKHGVPVSCRATTKQLLLEFPTDGEHQKHVDSTLEEINQDCTVSNRIDESVDVTMTKTTTALHLASRNENKAIAELLINHDAEVNAEMEGGETPLIVAVLYKRPATVDLLLEKGANVNAATAWGKSALHYAAQTGQRAMVDLLLRRGGEVNATNLEGLTPLHIAAEAGHKDVVAMLLKNGGDFELRTKNGATVLHYAAVMGHRDVFEMILGNGADINSIMKHGGLDLSSFKWITPTEGKKTWEFVSRYTTKMSFVNWYSIVMMKFYKKSKERKALFHAETEK